MAVNWRVQGNLKVITADIKKVCPQATVYSVGDASHQSRASDHNPWNWGYGIVVSAIDVMIRNGFTKTDAANLVKALKGRSDIQYIIYNRTIWSASWGWKARAYRGSDPHTDHVHVSAKHTRAADQTVKHVTFRPVPVNKPVVKPVSKPTDGKPATKPAPVSKPVTPKPVKAPPFPLGPNSSYGEYKGNRNTPSKSGVRMFQAQLRKRGWDIDVDGKFGEETTRIVKEFQKQKHLKRDGLVGPVTWRAIWEAPVTSK